MRPNRIAVADVPGPAALLKMKPRVAVAEHFRGFSGGLRADRVARRL